MLEIQRAETQSMAGPAEGTSAKSPDQAVPGAVANRREMVLFVAVAPEIRDAARGRFVGPSVATVVDSSAQPGPGFHQGHLESGLRKRVGGDATSGSAAYDANVIGFGRHPSLSGCSS